VSFLELGFGEAGIVFEENWPDGLLPGEVDQFLMALDRVGHGGPCQEEQGEESDRF
jgi:hypothetical protein